MARGTATYLCSLALLINTVACAVASEDLPPRADAGEFVMPPPPPPPPLPEKIIETTRVMEDFDSRRFIDKTHVALLDVNRGEVRLPSIAVPNLDPKNTHNVLNVASYDGVVEGGSIIVEDTVTIDGVDAVELRAHDELRILGALRAGAGGVTLVAGRGIRIDGSIESEGPIRLRLTEASGAVEISGRLHTLTTSRQPSAPISILSRGQVRISGQVTTGDAQNADSGKIEITAYGDIEITGRSAQLVTGDSDGGHAGPIELSTELEVRITDSARLTGGDATPGEGRTGRASGGSVDVRATRVVTATTTAITAGAGREGDGGHLSFTATETLTFGPFAMLNAGSGDTGGNIELRAAQTTFVRGVTAAAGYGAQISGRVFSDTSGDVSIDGQVALAGGDGGCTDGGPVVLLIGGQLFVDLDALLQGGRGGTDVGAECIGAYAGGDVTVIAQRAPTNITGVSRPGSGTPDGRTAVTIDPSYRRLAPDIAVNAVGWVESKTIDRLETSVGLIPRLVDLRTNTPLDTVAKVQLARSWNPDGPFGPWYDATVGDRKELEPLATARYLRFRLWLEGRALDTPVVDGLEIDFAPAD